MKLIDDVKKLVKKINKIQSGPNYYSHTGPNLEKDLPNKFFLTLTDVRNIAKGKTKSIVVLVPQVFEDHENFTRSWLEKNYTNGGFDDPDPWVHFQGYDEGRTGIATTGSGSDPYLKISVPLRKWLENYISSGKVYAKNDKRKGKVTRKKGSRKGTSSSSYSYSSYSHKTGSKPKYVKITATRKGKGPTKYTYTSNVRRKGSKKKGGARKKRVPMVTEADVRKYYGPRKGSKTRKGKKRVPMVTEADVRRYYGPKKTRKGSKKKRVPMVTEADVRKYYGPKKTRKGSKKKRVPMVTAADVKKYYSKFGRKRGGSARGDPSKFKLGTRRGGYVVEKCWVKA